jgi:porin
LPGTFKLGGWFDTAPDLNASSAQPWNYGFYFVADQMLYRVQQTGFTRGDNKDNQAPPVSVIDKGLGIFTHVGVAPRNSSLINFYIDGGLNYKGLLPTRDSDILGFAIAYGHLRNNLPNSQGRSDRGYEMVLETTYEIELTPWLSLQPDVQYVIHPSGTNIPNALVLGARATVSF